VVQQLVFTLAAVVALVFITAGRLFVARVGAVRRGKVKVAHYAMMSGHGDPPLELTLLNRHLANLFELPVLFFAAVVLVIVLHIDDGIYVAVAWTYVAARAAHTLIHTTYNRVSHRVAMFALSNFVLGAMWIRIVFDACTRLPAS
jgi:hypothetical protein